MKAAPIVGRVAPTNEFTITVGLVVDSNALVTAATQVSDPQSPTYRQYKTAEQVADEFGAGPSDYQRLLAWGRSYGLVPTAHKNRFVATFTGPANKIEEALHVHLNNGLRPDGTQFFGPDREPSLDLALPVEHIGGLNNYKPPTRAGGSGSGGDYQGSDFRNAYASGTTLTGAGQSVGIFMLDGFAQSDITAYGKLLNETFVPIRDGAAQYEHDARRRRHARHLDGAGDGAGGASRGIRRQYDALINSMTDREDIKQFTSSWFWYDGSTTDTNLMATLAMQGQSFFQASGDGGTYPANWPKGYVSGSLDCRQFPFITIAGGTDLNMANDGSSYGTLETGVVAKLRRSDRSCTHSVLSTLDRGSEWRVVNQSKRARRQRAGRWRNDRFQRCARRRRWNQSGDAAVGGLYGAGQSAGSAVLARDGRLCESNTLRLSRVKRVRITVPRYYVGL